MVSVKDKVTQCITLMFNDDAFSSSAINNAARGKKAGITFWSTSKNHFLKI